MTPRRTRVAQQQKPFPSNLSPALLNLEDSNAYKIAYSAVDEKTESKYKSLKTLVDVRGFEPLTPCLQSRCSPS